MTNLQQLLTSRVIFLSFRFVKADEVPYIRCDVNKYSKMDIDEFFADALPKIARGKNERWENFQKRKSKAEAALNKFVYGKYYGKFFELRSIPSEYFDYQYSKHSEFGSINTVKNFGQVLIGLDMDEVHKFIDREHGDPQKLVEVQHVKANITTYNINRINCDRIGVLFDYWKARNFLLNNSIEYIRSNCNSNGCISVTRWITATGKSGRTKEIESLTDRCDLSWKITSNSSSPEIAILSPNNIVIGEINWKNDEDHLDDTEFNEVYKPLLSSGCADIKSVQLQKLIPHGSPKGRPRKALVQVLITLQVKNLDAYEASINRIKQDIQSMRTLAAIDHNRKCDLIEGVIPECISSIGELFANDEFPRNSPFAVIDILQSGRCLSGFALTAAELEEIWSIYMPIKTFCLQSEGCDKYFGYKHDTLFCRRRYFNYTLEYERREVCLIDEELIYRNILRLSLYRNVDKGIQGGITNGSWTRARNNT